MGWLEGLNVHCGNATGNVFCVCVCVVRVFEFVCVYVCACFFVSATCLHRVCEYVCICVGTGTFYAFQRNSLSHVDQLFVTNCLKRK